MANNKKGFTAIEMLISLAIMSIALGSIYGLYMSHVGVYTTESVASRVQQNVRSSINIMVRDIRMAGLDPETTGLFGIQQAEDQTIRFTADRDMDGALDDTDLSDGSDDSDLEQIAYAYDGNNVLQMILYHADNTIESQDTLVDNVANFPFSRKRKRSRFYVLFFIRCWTFIFQKKQVSYEASRISFPMSDSHAGGTPVKGPPKSLGPILE